MKYEIENNEKIAIDYISCNGFQKSVLDDFIDVKRAEFESNIAKIRIDDFYNYNLSLVSDIDNNFLESLNTELLFKEFCFPDFFHEKLDFDYWGGIGQKQFNVKLSYKKRKVIYNGPFLIRENDSCILGSMSYDLYNFFRLIDNIDQEEVARRTNIHRKILAKAQKLESLGILNNNLLTSSRKFIEIDRPLGIDIEANPETKEIQIMPYFTDEGLTDEMNNSWKETFQESEEISNIVNLNVKNEKKGNSYLLFNESKKEEVNAIKKVIQEELVDRNKTKDFINHPEKYLDPDIYNLETFSTRVKEIGLLNVKPLEKFGFIEVDWWDDVDFSIMSFLQDVQKNSSLLEELKIAFYSAKKNNLDEFEFHGVNLFTAIVEEFLQDVELKTKSQSIVPIAKSNMDEVEYSVDNSDLNQYVFHKIDDEFNFKLRTYQEIGVAWLQSLFLADRSGCLLADDMGLGKTLQILYFMEWANSKSLKEHQRGLSFLLVTPLSLKENWNNEYNSFFNEKGNLHFTEDKTIINSKLQNNIGLVCITTYQNLQRNQLEYSKISWDIVLADEFQYSKNPATRISNAMKSLKSNFNVAITGTPVENDFIELWNIVDWVAPGQLGSLKEFRKQYDIDKEFTIEQVNENAKEIRAKIGDLLLRRRKEDVLASELPKKIIHDDVVKYNKKIKLNCKMAAYQAGIYKELRQEAGRYRHTKKVFTFIEQMKKVCDHPRFYGSQINKINTFSQDFIDESAKLVVVEKILDNIKTLNEKVLIFAEYRLTQKILAGWIMDKYGIEVPVINGESPIKDYYHKTKSALMDVDEFYGLSRQSCVKKFNELDGFRVMVLSPIAAGVGLNITGANHVIHYSRHWNPAKENQATDRVYRIGQKKDVHIYYPKAIHNKFATFDENIARILQKKSMITQEMLFPTNYDDKVVSFDDFIN